MQSARAVALDSEPEWPSSRYAWFVTVILTLALVLAYIDRSIIAMLAVPIKRDLGLSDSELGLIIGLAFSCAYSFAAIPMGRIVDASSRRRVIFVGVAVWSCLTAASGAAASFWHLFAARALVGVGEASIFPASSSLIGDYFPPNRRMRAASLFIFGAALGGALAYILGGVLLKAFEPYAGQTLPLIGTVQPWQLVFYACGIAGLLFLPVILLIKEPVRQDKTDPKLASGYAKPSLKHSFAYLIGEGRGLLALIVSVSLMLLLVSGLIAWLPTLFSRRFSWEAAKIGPLIGSIALTSGVIGAVLANVVVEKFAKRNAAEAIPRAAFWFCVLGAVPLIGSVLMPSGEWVAVALFPALTFAMGFMPFSQGAIQLVVPNRMRGQMTGIVLFITSLFSSALGPVLVGFFTDFVFRDEMKLHYSLALAGLVTIPPAAFLLLYSRRRFATLTHMA